jgi:hypothetical protein
VPHSLGRPQAVRVSTALCRAIADLFSHRGGGQQSREGSPEAVVEQAQYLTIALSRSVLNLRIFCRCFSLVGNFLVFDNLPFIEVAQAGSLDSRNMDKDIFSAALRLNKSLPFLGIEPLHRTARHF